MEFFHWGSGLVTGGTSKGYVYRTEPPSPLVDSLERIPFPVESLKPVYRRIADNWYLHRHGDPRGADPHRLRRGSVVTVVLVEGMLHAGQKAADCTLEISVDEMQRLLAFDRGTDTSLRTWVHESLHARSYTLDGTDAARRAERGLTERGEEHGQATSLHRRRRILA